MVVFIISIFISIFQKQSCFNHQRISQPISKEMNMGNEDNLAAIKKEAEDLVKRARASGLVLNIESVPDMPLAMGNYHEEVALTPLRLY